MKGISNLLIDLQVTSFFSHQKFLSERPPLTMPLGPMTRYAQTELKTEFELTTEGLVVREAIPPNFISDSIPADVSVLTEYR